MNSIKNLLEDRDQLLGGSQLEELEEVEEIHYFTCPSIVDYRETEAGHTELTFSDKKYMKVPLVTA